MNKRLAEVKYFGLWRFKDSIYFMTWNRLGFILSVWSNQKPQIYLGLSTNKIQLEWSGTAESYNAIVTILITFNLCADCEVNDKTSKLRISPLLGRFVAKSEIISRKHKANMYNIVASSTNVNMFANVKVGRRQVLWRNHSINTEG